MKRSLNYTEMAKFVKDSIEKIGKKRTLRKIEIKLENGNIGIASETTCPMCNIYDDNTFGCPGCPYKPIGCTLQKNAFRSNWDYKQARKLDYSVMWSMAKDW